MNPSRTYRGRAMQRIHGQRDLGCPQGGTTAAVVTKLLGQAPEIPGPMPKPAPKPVVKWAGGKWRVYEQFQHLVPRSYGRLIEPFAGGAAVFFREAARGGFRRGAVLLDTNEELVNLYRVLQTHPERLVAEVRRMKTEHERRPEAYFYEVRDDWAVAGLAPHQRAARMLYLNKTCFNGLYRVNAAGKFNVPFGRHASPAILDEKNVLAAHEVLQGAVVEVADFGKALEVAEAGDFAYFDPPYDPLSATSNFTAYSKDAFGRAEQLRLAETFRRLAKRGVHCLLSNSDTPFVRETYEPLRDELPSLVIQPVSAPRSINSNGARRGAVGEVVIASSLPEASAAGSGLQERLPEA